MGSYEGLYTDHVEKYPSSSSKHYAAWCFVVHGGQEYVNIDAKQRHILQKPDTIEPLQ